MILTKMFKKNNCINCNGIYKLKCLVCINSVTGQSRRNFKETAHFVPHRRQLTHFRSRYLTNSTGRPSLNQHVQTNRRSLVKNNFFFLKPANASVGSPYDYRNKTEEKN